MEVDMVSFEALGLRRDNRLMAELIREAHDNPSLIFRGYSGTYYYRNLGVAEFSVEEIEKDDGAKEFRGFSTHLMGSHSYRMKISALMRSGDMKCCCLCSPSEDDSLVIPVSFVMGDVMPSLLPGDSVFCQTVAFLYSGRFYASDEDAENDSEVAQQRKLVTQEPGFVFFRGDGSPLDGYLPVYTEVHSLKRYPSYIQTEDRFFSIFTVEAVLPFGEVTLAVSEGYLTPRIIRMLERGESVMMYGYLHFSGDVAVGEYQNGAVFDEAHLLRVLRDALETCNLERLERTLSPDCEYYGTEGRRLCGRADIVSQMRRVLDAQHENRDDIQHQAVATVIEVTDPDRAEYGIGKQCLLSYSVNSKGGAQCIIFIEVEDSKISTLKFRYESYYRMKVDESTFLPAGRPVFTTVNKK